MAEQIQDKSWLLVQVENAVRAGLTRAYQSIRVEPNDFLFHLRSAHELPIESYDGLFSVSVARLDEIAGQTLRAGMKLAAAEGAGLGVGGALTIVPDLGILAAITMRTLQKLSLIYGFQFSTDEEVAELWIAAASAAGVDIGRELLEKGVVRRFVPKVIQRIAVSASAEIVEKWSARLIPVVSSGHRRGLQLLLRARLGKTGVGPLPRETSRDPRAAAEPDPAAASAGRSAGASVVSHLCVLLPLKGHPERAARLSAASRRICFCKATGGPELALFQLWGFWGIEHCLPSHICQLPANVGHLSN